MPTKAEVEGYRRAHPPKGGRRPSRKQRINKASAQPSKGLRKTTTGIFSKGSPVNSIGMPVLLIGGLVSTCTAPYSYKEYAYSKSQIVDYVGATNPILGEGYSRAGYDITLADKPGQVLTVEGYGYVIDVDIRGRLFYDDGRIIPEDTAVIQPGLPQPTRKTHEQSAGNGVTRWVGDKFDAWKENDITQAGKRAAGSLVVFAVPDNDRVEIDQGWVSGIYGRNDSLHVVMTSFDWGPIAVLSIAAMIIGLVGTFRLAFVFFN